MVLSCNVNVALKELEHEGAYRLRNSFGALQ